MTASVTDWEKRLDRDALRRDLFIDGRFVPAASGERFVDTTPRDGSVLAEIAAAGEEDVDRAVRAAQRAFDAGSWSQADPGHRKAVLLRFAELITEHREELA